MMGRSTLRAISRTIDSEKAPPTVESPIRIVASIFANHVGKSDLAVGSPRPSSQTFLRLSIDGLFGGQIFSP